MKHLVRHTLAILFGTCTLAAWAQSTATLSGAVTDPSGAAVSHAHVTVHSLATGGDRGLDTDAAGLYVVPSLQPGDYILTATCWSTLTVLTPGGVVAPTSGFLTGASRGLGANSFITAGNREDSVNYSGGKHCSQIESQTMTVGQVIARSSITETLRSGGCP
ncbi:MAG TPA: carboxypeptidase-like regulatory domain-containing protein [Granulicella sp.]|jgi:hypothetical protein|nr:carboxypeptidase-like regulatory domain-containing protein [Granulicella sp.]